MSILNKIKLEQPGYRIKDSHYKIGTKLHITDFYYTKRFFQNSFYSSKMAFIVAESITKKLEEHALIADIREKGFTLIGYGLYSELFMSLVERFVEKKLKIPTGLVNHNIFEDSSKPGLVKKEQVTKPYSVIVIPIASTFSTAIKIENYLKETKVIPTCFNVIHVRDSHDEPGFSALEKEFGWESEDRANNEIRVKSFSLNELRDQRYFISVPTKWKPILSCNDCIPLSEEGMEDPMMEKVSYDTDQSGTTPNIIFDFPRGRLSDEGIPVSKNYELSDEMIKYGHHIRNNDHFFYSIDTERFFRKNLEGVEDWLSAVQEHLIFNKCLDRSKQQRILLIASCHYSNASFISAIYETIFSSAANIIHYDPQNDYMQNFAVLYKNDLMSADKIFFIDDSLKSGKAFFRIRDLVSYSSDHQKKIDAVIFLINKAQAHIHQLIRSGINSGFIYSFANLNLSSTYTQDNSTILTGEVKKYTAILKQCNLSSIQDYFQSYLGKFRDDYNATISSKAREEHLYFIEGTHRIYQAFNDSSICAGFSQMEFNNFISYLKTKTYCGFSTSNLARSVFPGISEFGLSVLKVLTLPPFLQFQPLRERAFGWVLGILNSLIADLNKAVSGDKLNEDHIEAFRFIIRRACALQSNYLISTKILLCIKLLYTDKGIPKLIRQYSNSNAGGIFDKVKKLKEFSIYYCAQLKELFFNNPVSSIVFHKRCWKILNNGKQNSKGFEHFVRLILFENFSVLQNHISYLTSLEKWKKNLIGKNGLTNEAEIFTKDISDFLANESNTNHSSHKLLASLFDELEKSEAQPRLLYPYYLWLKNYIDLWGADVRPKLIDKTGLIFSMIKAPWMIGFPDDEQFRYGGAFLIVNDLANTPFLVFDKDADERKVMNPDSWDDSKNSLIINYLSGELETPQNKYRTIIELERNTSSKTWNNSFEFMPGEDEINLSYDFVPEGNNKLILLRLNKWEPNQVEKTLGVIGIYFFSKNSWMQRFNRLQFLLILKDDLANFIEKHHRNNEFNDFLIEEKSKELALLAGHGKDMMKKLASSGKDTFFSTIVFNLEYLQKAFSMDRESYQRANTLQRLLPYPSYQKLSSNKVITKEYEQVLNRLVNDIFASPDIETNVPVIPEIEIEPDLNFYFNEDILNLIFFELIINAKKNRWHFIDGLNGTIGPEVIENISKNIVRIKLSSKPDGLKKILSIEMDNTGPEIQKQHYRALNDMNGYVKQHDEIEGIKLLKLLIQKYLKGTIYFPENVKKICNVTDLTYFSVHLTFNEMNHE